jgi:hypothetical protein
MDDRLLDEIILSSDSIYKPETTEHSDSSDNCNFSALLGIHTTYDDDIDDSEITRVVTPSILSEFDKEISLDIPYIYSEPVYITKMFSFGINVEFENELEESKYNYAQFCHFCGIHSSEHMKCRHAFIGIDATKTCKICKKFYFQHFPESTYLPTEHKFHYFQH